MGGGGAAALLDDLHMFAGGGPAALADHQHVMGGGGPAALLDHQHVMGGGGAAALPDHQHVMGGGGAAALPDDPGMFGGDAFAGRVHPRDVEPAGRLDIQEPPPKRRIIDRSGVHTCICSEVHDDAHEAGRSLRNYCGCFCSRCHKGGN